MKEWWLAIFANAIVIVGWFIVFLQSKTIKNREEVRSLIDKISTIIDDIYILTIQYYDQSSRKHISHKSAEIRSKFVILSRLLLLVRYWDKDRIISPALVAFKMTCTGNFFETTRFQEQSDIPDWKSELASSAQDLKFKIESSYFRRVGVVKR